MRYLPLVKMTIPEKSDAIDDMLSRSEEMLGYKSKKKEKVIPIRVIENEKNDSDTKRKDENRYKQETNKQKCSSLTKNGNQCKNWVRSEGLCAVHLRIQMPNYVVDKEKRKEHCSSLTKNGNKCKNYVSSEHLCGVHLRMKKSGKKLPETIKMCSGITKKGEKCSRRALLDEEYCGIHLKSDSEEDINEKVNIENMDLKDIEV